MDKEKLLGELQLGNFVQHRTPDGEYKAEERGIFQWTEYNWLELEECILDDDDLFPIKLDNKWLKVFKCKIDRGRIEFPDDNLWQFTLSKSTFESVTTYSLEVNLSYTYVKIEYVHQFQNLYSMLSNGKKLEYDIQEINNLYKPQ